MAGLTSLASLLGRWAIARDIRHSDGTSARMHGQCTFAKVGPRVVQEETGTLETPAGQFAASRRYVWAEEAGMLAVYFEDMRPFHSVALNLAEQSTVHLCPPDRYHVRYDFTDWPRWSSLWTVEGPRKDYEMETRFSPLSPSLESPDAAVHNNANET